MAVTEYGSEGEAESFQHPTSQEKEGPSHDDDEESNRGSDCDSMAVLIQKGTTG
jgi:hypothetical protein